MHTHWPTNKQHCAHISSGKCCCTARLLLFSSFLVLASVHFALRFLAFFVFLEWGGLVGIVDVEQAAHRLAVAGVLLLWCTGVLLLWCWCTGGVLLLWCLGLLVCCWCISARVCG
jgi:hypothetical protein